MIDMTGIKQLSLTNSIWGSSLNILIDPTLIYSERFTYAVYYSLDSLYKNFNIKLNPGLYNVEHFNSGLYLLEIGFDTNKQSFDEAELMAEIIDNYKNNRFLV